MRYNGDDPAVREHHRAISASRPKEAVHMPDDHSTRKFPITLENWESRAADAECKSCGAPSQTWRVETAFKEAA